MENPLFVFRKLWPFGKTWSGVYQTADGVNHPIKGIKKMEFKHGFVIVTTKNQIFMWEYREIKRAHITDKPKTPNKTIMGETY
jgi:hypothetical protein